MELSAITYHSPCGALLLAARGESLLMCDWEASSVKRSRPIPGTDDSHPVIRQAIAWLDDYFAGGRPPATLPLDPIGTEFQRSVWQALCDIPYGSAVSYAEVARRVGRERAVRAVATAIGHNPISLFIPCHRVIGSDGAMHGYDGGLEAKRYLLELEGVL